MTQLTNVDLIYGQSVHIRVLSYPLFISSTLVLERNRRRREHGWVPTTWGDSVDRAADILRRTGVNKSLARDVIGAGATGKRRMRTIVFGLIAIAIGVGVLYYSVQLATRVTALAAPAVASQTGSNTTNPAVTDQNIQYGIWAVGAALIAYGTNKIRRG